MRDCRPDLWNASINSSIISWRRMKTEEIKRRLPASAPLSMARIGDGALIWLSRGAAWSVISLAALLVLFLVAEAWPALSALGVRFLFEETWDPVHDRYGALAFVYGTVASALLAMVLAIPVSLGAAVFLSEIAPRWLQHSGSFLIELLAAIPSVVFGFWGIFFLAPAVQKFFDILGGPNTGGSGILAAGIILAIMIVPYIAAVAFDVCQAVPRSQREAALATGATRWQTTWSVVLPYARPGIVGASFLALGRALGETMAVTMLIGNNPVLDFSVFALGDSLASVIANQLGNTPNELHRAALVELGLVLLLVAIVTNSLARFLIRRIGRPGTNRRAGLLSFWTKSNHLWGRNACPADLPALPQRHTFNRRLDRLMTGVLACCFVLVSLPLFLILGLIAVRGFGTLDWNFFARLPIDDPPGLGHALVGSAMLVGLATVLGAPLALLAAVFLSEYRNSRLAHAVRFIGELLGGVPSIILGIFGYALLVVPWGFSAWAGAFALSVMMVPIVMRTAEESLKLVPSALRNASLALGATTWQTVSRVLLPAAWPAILTGVFLAVARIAGETAPLLLTAYNSSFWPRSPNERTPFLTYYIYTYSRSEMPEEQALAWTAALVLLVVVMALNVGVRRFGKRRPVLAGNVE
jgi:phosphate transport system permease protein